MTFARVYVLYCIWAAFALFLIYALGMKRRNAILSRYSSPKGLLSIAAGASNKRRWIQGMLFCLSLAFCVAALAGPRYGYVWREVQRKGVDLVLALDCSKSMLAKDISPSRLDRAKREIQDLLGRMYEDRVALVTFSGTAFLQVPLTLDHSGFNLFLQTASPDNFPVGGTNMAAAVETGLKAFSQESEADKAIILITDGEATGADPVAAARTAKQQGVRIFCIGVGGETGAPVPEPGGGFKKTADGNILLAKLDETVLKKVAEITGGAYVRSVAGDMDLDIIYEKEIREKLTRATVEGGKKQVFQDRFQWLLLPGFLLMAAAMAVGERKKAFYLAAAVLLAGLLVSPDSAMAGLFEKGQKAYAEKEYETARSFFEQALEKQGDIPEILFNLGDTLYRMGEFAEAKTQFEKALALSREELKQHTHYNLGNTLFRLGQPEKAVEQYENALDMEPTDKLARENLEYVKKWMEKQKQSGQSSNSGDSKQNQDQNKDPQSGQQPDSSQKEQGGQKPGEPDTEKGNSKKDQSSEQSEQAPKQNPGEEDREKQREDSGREQSPENLNQQSEENSGQAAGDETGEKQPVSPDMAQTILNRLKDQPGKALMPRYGKQKVEKDW